MKVQHREFKKYNLSLSKKLKSMEKSDKRFWNLAKEISGLEQSRNKAAPSVNDLADHFASKMSNAADVHDNDWAPPAHWKGKAKLSSFKVDQRTVLKCLKSLDINKSINGITLSIHMQERRVSCSLENRSHHRTPQTWFSVLPEDV